MRCTRELLAWALVLAACRESDGAENDSAADDESTTSAADDDDESDTSGDASEESESTGTPPEWASLDERPCPEDSDLTWENFGGPFVLTYCAGCHHSELPADVRQNAPYAINLESVELVRTNADRMWARAADQNATMPPAGAAADDERTLLGEWLACGAPTNEDLGILE
jgi:hypothetical protein